MGLNTRWISVGDNGKAAYSDNDGASWTSINNIGIVGKINGIAYGNGAWVAVGEFGQASYSLDNGNTWNVIDGTGIQFNGSHANSIAYGDGKFIVVGNHGRASYSYNLKDWVLIDIGFDGVNINKIICKYDKWVWYAVGGNILAYSYDGISWVAYAITDITNNILCIDQSWAKTWLLYNSVRAVYHYNNRWLMGDDDGYVYGWSTTNDQMIPIFNFGVQINDIKCIRDKWIIIGPNKYATMNTDFSGLSIYNSQIVGDIALDTNKKEHRFVVSGQDSSTNASITDNGYQWKSIMLPRSEGIKMNNKFVYTICATDRSLVAAGADGMASYSEDGINWQALPAGAETGMCFGTDTINSMAYEPVSGMFFAVGDSGKWSFSADFGKTWEPGDTDIKFSGDNINGITVSNSNFIAVGDSGKASYFNFISSGWTELIAGADTGIKFDTSTATSVAYGNGTCVVVGIDGKASYSTDDGLSWTKLTPGDETGIKFDDTIAHSVCFGGDKFVVVGNNGKGSYSYDGINWTKITSFGATDAIFNVKYYNGCWFAVGSIFTESYTAGYFSDDGINWYQRNLYFNSFPASGYGLSPVPNFRKNKLRQYSSSNGWKYKRMFTRHLDDWRDSMLKFKTNPFGWVMINNNYSTKISIGKWYAWGRNDYGQLGIGNNDNKNVPTVITDPNDWETIVAGGYHTLGLKKNK